MPENKEFFPVESEHELEWIDGTIPRSRRFGDTYFSQYGGLDETSQVYIGWNDLLQRWPQMRHCTIAELGFGTGLNFLETMRQWREHRQAGATLHFISFEAYPLKLQDLQKALTRWPQLSGQAQALVEQWRPEAAVLDARFGNDTRLTVHFADANQTLAPQTFVADAWYLDGFAPSRNPQLWSAQLMRDVYARTVPGGSFTTYTSAGWVKRNLQAAGFVVEKLPGFAAKREMLRGRKLSGALAG